MNRNDMPDTVGLKDAETALDQIATTAAEAAAVMDEATSIERPLISPAERARRRARNRVAAKSRRLNRRN